MASPATFPATSDPATIDTQEGLDRVGEEVIGSSAVQSTIDAAKEQPVAKPALDRAVIAQSTGDELTRPALAAYENFLAYIAERGHVDEDAFQLLLRYATSRGYPKQTQDIRSLAMDTSPSDELIMKSQQFFMDQAAAYAEKHPQFKDMLAAARDYMQYGNDVDNWDVVDEWAEPYRQLLVDMSVTGTRLWASGSPIEPGGWRPPRFGWNKKTFGELAKLEREISKEWVEARNASELNPRSTDLYFDAMEKEKARAFYRAKMGQIADRVNNESVKQMLLSASARWANESPGYTYSAFDKVNVRKRKTKINQQE